MTAEFCESLKAPPTYQPANQQSSDAAAPPALHNVCGYYVRNVNTMCTIIKSTCVHIVRKKGNIEQI